MTKSLNNDPDDPDDVNDDNAVGHEDVQEDVQDDASEDVGLGWYRALQREFSATLRTPLSTEGGRFHSTRAQTAPFAMWIVDDGPGAHARIALYHEQYWARLFNVFQETFPRCSHLLTPFRFNARVMDFVVARADVLRGVADLADVGDGFVDALVAAVATDVGAGVDADRLAALRSAATLDEAERRALRARPPPPMRAEAETLSPSTRVQVAPSFSLVQLQHEVRARAPRATPLPQAAFVVVARARDGVVVVDVDVVFARFLRWARTLANQAPHEVTLGAVLSALLPQLPPSAHAAIASEGPLVARWVRDARAWGVFTAVVADAS